MTRYAKVPNLAEWLDIDIADLETRDPRVKVNLNGVETRMSVIASPSLLVTPERVEAFILAIFTQYEYEQQEAASDFMGLPSDVTSFSTGNFSVSRGGRQGQGDALFPAGLSPSANAYLAAAGLLYAGAVPDVFGVIIPPDPD
jgi:hypothetical protein